jgi:hypothetical protein
LDGFLNPRRKDIAKQFLGEKLNRNGEAVDLTTGISLVGIIGVLVFNVYEFRKVGKSVEQVGKSVERNERRMEREHREIIAALREIRDNLRELRGQK